MSAADIVDISTADVIDVSTADTAEIISADVVEAVMSIDLMISIDNVSVTADVQSDCENNTLAYYSQFWRLCTISTFS